MTDQPQQAENMESAETPQAPMPSAEQTPQDEQVPGSEQSEVRETASDATLPEGVKERTAFEFEKLKTQLREEREKRQRAERASQLYGQPFANQPQLSQPAGQYPQTEADRISRAELMAQQAYNQAQRIIQENDSKQEKEAYEAHPELDPNRDKDFNPDFHKAVVGYLASVMAEGKSMSLKEAAAKVKGFSKADLKKAQEQGATQAIERLTPKEQASLEATGRSDRRRQTGDLENLRSRTRQGDQSAIQERLKNIPMVGR